MTTNERPNQEDLAEYFQLHRDDDSEWEERPEPAVRKPGNTIVYSIRLRPSELAQFKRVAASRGISISELIRSSVTEHLRESDISEVRIVGHNIRYFSRSNMASAGTRGNPPVATPAGNRQVATG